MNFKGVDVLVTNAFTLCGRMMSEYICVNMLSQYLRDEESTIISFALVSELAIEMWDTLMLSELVILENL